MTKCPNPTLPNVTTAALAELTGLSVRQINRLAKDRVFARAARNSFELQAVIPALIRYYAQGAEGDGDLAAENIRHRIASRREIEQRTALRAQRLIPAEQVKAEIAAVMTMLAAQLNGVAGRICNEVAAEGDPAHCKRIIFDEIRRLRDTAAAALHAQANLDSGSGGDSESEGDERE